mmetsp:Transcript_31989/g.78488  ORF Transcript_31989/g.78488 Transcript_31989/m.78488 type:complete len:97 (+) Transcript_31989:300-590(+)
MEVDPLEAGRCTHCLKEGADQECHPSTGAPCHRQGHKICLSCWLLLKGEDAQDRHFCGLWERVCLHAIGKVGFAAMQRASEEGAGGAAGSSMAGVT